MRIGGLYRVLGIPAHVHQWPNVTWSIEANGVQPWEPERKAEIDLMLELSMHSPIILPAFNYRLDHKVEHTLGHYILMRGVANLAYSLVEPFLSFG